MPSPPPHFTRSSLAIAQTLYRTSRKRGCYKLMACAISHIGGATKQYFSGKHGQEVRKLFNLFFTTVQAGVNLKIQIQVTLR